MHVNRIPGRHSQFKNPAAGSVADGGITAVKLAGSALDAARGMVNGKIVESRAGNAATFALKTLAGSDPSASDPVLIPFNDGAGGYVMRSLQTAASVTLSSGSTAGAANGVPFRLWITAHDDAGTVRFGVSNRAHSAGVLPIEESGPVSTTAEGGAGGADSAGVIYTGTAVTAKLTRLLAHFDYDSGLTTAGAWDAAPTRGILFGPGVRRPGDLVQCVRTATASVATGTTQIPGDNTIPQSSEGDQYLSQAIMPTAVMNRLEISVLLQASINAAATAIGALFQDSAANALSTSWASINSAGTVQTLPIYHEMRAGTLAATTFKVRAGPNAANTFTLNGSGGSGFFNGTLFSHLEIAERMG